MTPLPQPPALRDLETEVMDVLWDRGEATVRQVCEELVARGGDDRAYTTVMTTCSRLAGKGVLERHRLGLADVYAPTMSRETYRERRAQAGVAALLDEAGDLALVHFARQLDELDPERRAQLERLARGES